MITRSVVLVLGAGASKPYGFPLAKELLRTAIALEGEALDMLRRARFTDDHIATFTDQLESSQLPSIDAFLEYRPEFTEVGKALMAYYLVSHEDPHYVLVPKGDQHWYQYLYHQMKTPVLDDFAKNRLSVITFNYDRSFEFYFNTVLAATHGADVASVRQVLSSIPVVHVHGSLGPLPGYGDDARAFEKALTSDGLLAAAKNIRIVSETVPHGGEFEQAHTLLSSAEIVLFFGFGFHRQNVERLLLSEVLSPKCRVTGTVYGFTQSEFDQNIKPLFTTIPGAALTKNDQNALDFLRNNLRLLGLR